MRREIGGVRREAGKNLKETVIPAQAGIQEFRLLSGPRLRGGDEIYLKFNNNHFSYNKNPMDNEQILEQFEALHTKATQLREEFLVRSALKIAMEAKKFAKTHRLLIPYIHSCFQITNMCYAAFEPEVGADNAMEIIALVESEENARKFQNDFDQDHYAYTVHWVSACAYDNLAIHTAVRNGYNSPLVHGAVDDGIHVCRRTGKLECVECFREYAVAICFGSGNYEMGEHYARLCATSTAREHTDDRRYIGYKDLVDLLILQGKFQAALEVLDGTFALAETYHSPNDARIEVFYSVQKLLLLCGRENEFDDLLAEHGLARDELLMPTLEEYPELFQSKTSNDALALTMHGQPLEAAQVLKKWEQFLLSRDILHCWFDIRVQRIAALLLARDAGMTVEDNIDALAEELRDRASRASQWSAILSLDAMLNRTVKLNPLGIPYPIDIGPYATQGTPVSHSLLEMMLPLFEKPKDDTAASKPEEDDANQKSPIELEVDSWFEELMPLWKEEFEHMFPDKQENPEQVADVPFEKEALLVEMERKVYNKIREYSHETSLDENDFYALIRPIMEMRIMRDVTMTRNTWDWLSKIARKYPESGRQLSTLAFYVFHFKKIAADNGVDPELLGLPDGAELEQMAAKGFELEPNRTGSATTAGLVFRERGNASEAQRCFSRACQLDRKNEYTTVALVELYENGDRPKDALATIDLYARAGGRHPYLLWKSTQIAFHNDMPQPFLLYYDAYMESEDLHPQLETQRVWALIKTGRFNDAIKVLDELDELFKDPARDRLFTRALCYIEGEKNETKFFESFEAALDLTGDPQTEGLLGTAFEPCAELWPHVKNLCAETDLRRFHFERFLHERGLLGWDYFSRDEDEEEGEGTESQQRGLFRCVLRQPLSPDVPAYAAWTRIPQDEPAYGAPWLVLAQDEEEAIQLALQEQKRCYSSPAQVLGCEQVDTFYSDRSTVVNQGNRFSFSQEQE